MSSCLSVKTSLREENGTGHGCVQNKCLCREIWHFVPLDCHALGTLLCAILSYCFGCELFWPCSLKLLSPSAIGRAARHCVLTTLQSWNWDSAPGYGLHTVWGTPFWKVWGREVTAGSADVCCCTNGREIFIMPEGSAVPEGQYGHNLPVPEEPRITKCFVKWWTHPVWCKI